MSRRRSMGRYSRTYLKPFTAKGQVVPSWRNSAFATD